jgi:hypothetical protein
VGNHRPREKRLKLRFEFVRRERRDRRLGINDSKHEASGREAIGD